MRTKRQMIGDEFGGLRNMPGDLMMEDDSGYEDPPPAPGDPDWVAPMGGGGVSTNPVGTPVEDPPLGGEIDPPPPPPDPDPELPYIEDGDDDGGGQVHIPRPQPGPVPEAEGDGDTPPVVAPPPPLGSAGGLPTFSLGAGTGDAFRTPAFRTNRSVGDPRETLLAGLDTRIGPGIPVAGVGAGNLGGEGVANMSDEDLLSRAIRKGRSGR